MTNAAPNMDVPNPLLHDICFFSYSFVLVSLVPKFIYIVSFSLFSTLGKACCPCGFETDCFQLTLYCEDLPLSFVAGIHSCVCRATALEGTDPRAVMLCLQEHRLPAAVAAARLCLIR